MKHDRRWMSGAGAVCLALVACDSGENGAGTRTADSGGPMNTAGSDPIKAAGSGPMKAAGSGPMNSTEAGLRWTADGALVLRTEQFTVAPGDERYLCWTHKTTEALKINEVSFPGGPGVHHIIFAKTTAPEPESFSECEVLFKPSWQQMFTTGAGAAKLTLPAGTAHEVPAGTQLLVQLHLVNTTAQDMSQAVEVKMEITDESNTIPVNVGGFGTFKVSLPPNQKTELVTECVLPKTARLVALLPHMHLLGTSMTLELGTSKDNMQVAYKRDPYDFDNQIIDNFDMTLEKGIHTRTTCKFNNTTDKTVVYGESTFDEMCFLGGFFAGGITNCVQFF